jgi:hypothetical protein
LFCPDRAIQLGGAAIEFNGRVDDSVQPLRASAACEPSAKRPRSFSPYNRRQTAVPTALARNSSAITTSKVTSLEAADVGALARSGGVVWNHGLFEALPSEVVNK